MLVVNVHGFGWPPLRPVQKHIDAEALAINEAGWRKSSFHELQVGAANQDIDIPRVANGPFIDSADPLGNRVATDHCVRDASLFERSSRTVQPLLHPFGCHERPFPARNDWCLWHEAASRLCRVPKMPDAVTSVMLQHNTHANSDTLKHNLRRLDS